VFVNKEELFKDNYMRYFKTRLVEEFGLIGVPIRINIRDNDYKIKNKDLKQNENKMTMKKLFLK